MINQEFETQPEIDPDDEMSENPEIAPDLKDDELRFAPAIDDRDQLTPAVEDAESLAITQVSDTDWMFLDSSNVLDVVEVGDLDVDAALQAVSSLSDMIAEKEAVEQAVATAEAERSAREEEFRSNPFPRPPMSSLQRGQIASIVPALALIAIGA